MSVETLLFQNPVWHPGLNVTVRLGDKWARIMDSGCKEVEIKKTGSDEVLAKAKLKTYAKIPFSLIPTQWLEAEHDPKCRDMHGLRQEMINAYGGKFDDDADVTVLWFEVQDGQSLRT